MTENGIAVEVTVSGYPVDSYRMPNGNVHNFKDPAGKPFSVWKDNDKPYSFKLNAAQIEYFQAQTYPILDVTCKRKPGRFPKLREWWYSGWNDFQIWDVDMPKLGEKTVTMVKTASGQVMHLDEDVSVFENAVNRLAKTQV